MFEVFGWIATVLFFLSYIPQLVRTYQLKTVDDISAPMWWALVVAYGSLLIYGAHLQSDAIVVNASLGLSCVLLMLRMYYFYRDPRKEVNRKIVAGFIKDSQRKFKEGDDYGTPEG